LTPGLVVHVHGQGPPVLLLHGQPGSAADFDDVVEALGPDVTTLAVDRPGWGATGGPARSLAAQAELLAEELLARGGAPAVVVGYSLGGGVALHLALSHPELVAGLVLVSSIGGQGSVNAVDVVLDLPVVGPLATWIAFAAMASLRPLVVRLGRWRLLAANLPGRPERLSVEQVVAFVDEQRLLLRDHAALEAALGRVDAPVIVLHGASDLVIPPTAGASLARALGVEPELLEGVGHQILHQAPEAVADAVRRLLGRGPLS
jgi:pimeloyl-ACP methyl ester carboxylesterase